MTNRRPSCGLATIFALVAATVPAAPADEPTKPPEPAKTLDLRVDPTSPPSPAFRYRLLPPESERTPGNAAPVYLRLDGETRDKTRDDVDEKTIRWLGTPANQFPAAEARAYVDGWGNKLRMIEFGAFREACNWDYTLPEQRNEVDTILLPDVQGTRRWNRLLALKVRVEATEHRFEDAVHTLETGLAFAKHVGGGPFLVNGLVGVANANVLFNELETLIAQPDAPNLYWALTALPRPLVPFRDAAERELAFGRWILPELADLDRPRTGGEWSARLDRLYARLVQCEADARETENSRASNGPKVDPVAILPDLAHFQIMTLPEARKFLETQARLTAAPSDAEAIVRYVAHLEAINQDDEAKAAALSYPEAGRFYDEADRQRAEAKRGPLRSLYARLVGMSIRQSFRAEALLDRRVAVLRVIEALRLHASRSGHLPKTLDEAKAVPIPLDPLTGQPFEYRLDGDTANLPAPSGLPKNSISSYRISLRL